MKFNFFQRRRLEASVGRTVLNELESPVTRKPQMEQEPAPEQSNVLGVMNMFLMRDGGVKTNFQWLPDLDTAKAFGEFLFCLHSGKMKHATISQLTDIATQDMTAKHLVNAIFEKWQELVILEEDRPLILPHEALRMGQNPEDE